MRSHRALAAGLLGLLAGPSPASTKTKPADAILLSTVKSLTLRADKDTSHRRVSPIPQLRCVSHSRVCALHTVDVMRCSNQGSSYGDQDIEWSCAASLPPELKLGATDVICEGYASPDDPYVLRGSCGVEYRLVLTEAGERRFPDIFANAGADGWFSGWGGRKGGHQEEPLRTGYNEGGGAAGEGSTAGAWLFGVVFVGVLLWIVYSAWTQANNPAGGGGALRRPRNFGGGGGGFDPGFGPGGGGGGYWGGGNGDDSPPPYSKQPGSSTQNQQGWRPGFWSGMAGGAAAAYLAGNRGNRQQEPRSYYGGGDGSSSSWGSAPGPSSSSRGQASGSASTSASRYSSTGFGSTSRR
ncbi:hypothetical protein F4808DRAFT_332618 [Astrocystis sublimbata]|nr:hypothetical protein F4808DRAFT_332618 [Astrocystis sublimbata]